ncbi:MAG: excinuclease ABC subunit UvrA [Promethearchaeota archaeon]
MPEYLRIRGARQHNLKDITVEIPRGRLVVITGVSGSGKSSLAMDTIYAEGQRRYIESLSTYARQFLGEMDKPDVDSIEGLSPAIAIEQKAVSKNPRSTVGTVTEIHDYLRLLYAHVGTPHCYLCGREIKPQTSQQIVEEITSNLPAGAKFQVVAPVVRGKKGEFQQLFKRLRGEGYLRVVVDGEPFSLEEDIVLRKQQKHEIDVVVDRLVMKDGVETRLADAVESALKLGEGTVKILVRDANETGQADGVLVYSEHYACPKCGISFPELVPRMFSFNNPYGYCKFCNGLGDVMVFDAKRIFPDLTVSIYESNLRRVPGFGSVGGYSWQMIRSVADYYGIDLDLPLAEIPPEKLSKILMGTGGEKVRMKFERNGDFSGRGDVKMEFRRSFEGIIPMLQRRYMQTDSEDAREWMEQFMVEQRCPKCQGSRLRPESLAVTVGGVDIATLSDMNVRQASEFINNLQLTDRQALIAKEVLKEIRSRYSFLVNVGLDYISMSRKARTLSGGESERIRLATQIGSNLVGVLYILDEPSIGLHSRDKFKLIKMLKHLRDLGNTVIVVEHDEDIIRNADFVVDLGPGAGEMGGEVVYAGPIKGIESAPRSLTGQYLSGKLTIPVPKSRRPVGDKFLVVKGARENNLKNVDVKFPLGVFTCVTGVSGAGKSSLVVDVLYRGLHELLGHKHGPLPGDCDGFEGVEQVDKVINIDQSPIGRTPRSVPATYTKVFDHIRALFAQTPEARARGYKPGRFSFNTKDGRCERCGGRGYNLIEMHFLPDVYVKCEVCKGRRYNSETLQVKYKGKTIAEVLEMSHTQALEFFGNVPKIREVLQTVVDVGLGYLELGQSSTTLSGGEAQRMKLARQLGKRATGKTVYILDEPTTGLHFHDVKKLLEVLQRLVDQGNTVIVIEHNMDVIKSADHVIDLGPEGGGDGGRVVACGTPEEICAVPESYTGQYLAPVLGIAREPSGREKAAKKPAKKAKKGK